MQTQPIPQSFLPGLIVLAIAVLATGLPVDIMDVDAAQYASISREMLQSGEFLQVLHRGGDYLDKPPLLFWTSAASFSLFGFCNAAYKLSSFLAILLAAYSIYRLVLIHYDRESGKLAALVFLSSVAVLLVANDVRTDTLLIGFATFSVWQAAAYFDTRKLVNAAGFGAGIGLAMLAKGPIGLVLPAAAIGWHVIQKKAWKRIADPAWLLSLLVIILVLLPMCWGLYHQYDLHPEKVLNGKTGISGLRFFFWEQSFGRITGESSWENDTGFFFFLHTFLWAFLPWAPVFLMMILHAIRSAWKRDGSRFRFREGFLMGAFVIPFIALSLSRYKLPHYIYITLPFGAAMTAIYLLRLSRTLAKRNLNILVIIQWAIWIFSLFFFTWLAAFAFPGNAIAPWILAACLVGLTVYGWVKTRRPARRVILLAMGSFCMVALALNAVFYPNLLKYQAGSQAGKWLTDNAPGNSEVVAFANSPNSLDYYSGQYRREVKDIEELASIADRTDNPVVIFTDDEGLGEIRRMDRKFQILFSTADFHVTWVSMKFLDPRRRDQAHGRAYLIQF